MGQVMAGRVLDAGHDLMVYNRTVEKSSLLGKRGAKVADSIAQACQHGGLVLTMLADDPAIDAVTRGPGGLLASLPPGGIHVAMGTHQISTIRALAEAHTTAGQRLVAAPVLGRPAVVAAGRAGIVAAGSAEAVQRAQPLFDAMGRRTFDAGTDPATAPLLKLCNNFVLACAIEVMGEAFALVQKSGGPLETFREVLIDGLFACSAYESYSRHILDKAWNDVNLTATLGLKDITSALAAAEAARVPLPSANVCRDRMLGAIAHGDGEKDWSVLALEQARSSGLA
jgi:3-hydroxyisobutyrate dehydrogenase-like beta-hydroxyacid dehydrogenase